MDLSNPLSLSERDGDFSEQDEQFKVDRRGQWGKTDIEVGDILYYTLQPKDLPVDPARQWRGKVTNVYPKTEWTVSCFIVSLLEPGYEGLDEIVYPSQVTGVEREIYGTPSSGPHSTHE